MTDLVHPDAPAINSDASEAEEARCPHPEVVPTADPNWGRCTACGDSTFPLTAFAAGEDDPEEPAPKKKRRKGTSPTARTLAECRRRGWIAGVVERHSPFPKPHGKKHDLFGVIDVVAIVMDHAGIAYRIDEAPPMVGVGTLGIQACTDGRTGTGGWGSDLAKRRAKILAEPRARAWVEAGNRLEIWAWGSRVVGKGRRWRVRVEAFTPESWRST